MKKHYSILSLLLILCLGGTAAAATPPDVATPTHDIRVLIDVSGSMKQNDPANLRKPALRLLTGLLPSGTQAGVWTFARYVNMLVRFGEVDTAWRTQAVEAAERINSAGLFTDIEAALMTAAWNWTADAPGVRRSIILLTDGLVDVSELPESDRLSRTRITDEILPRLQDAGVDIYTIALSDGTDQNLLQQLAAATGGWFEHAENADQLERIFLRMFEKAANPDTLPLIDNQVLVDDSIGELTLLVFRKDTAPATTLTMPDGLTFGSARLPPNVHWHSDARYDLVTVDKPATGPWHVNADTDPDNRVMVVSNLRVVATQLPNQILEGDTLDFMIRFTEQNQAITNKDFLHFLTVKTLESSAEGATAERLLLDNGRDGDIVPGDGIFGTQMTASGETGAHTVVVDVDGTTFRRQHRQDIEVVESPVIADIRADENGTTLSVIPRAGIIDPESLEVTATIIDDAEQSDTRRLARTSPGEWRLGLDEFPPDAAYRVTLDIVAERPNGKPFSYQSKPLRFGHAATLHEEPPEIAEDASEEELVDAEGDILEDAEAGEAIDSEEEPEQTSWALVITVVILLNALLGGGMFLVYRKLFGSSVKPVAEEEAEDNDRSAATPDAPSAVATPFDDSKPSVVTQVAEAAAAAETKAVADVAPAQEDAPAELDVEAAADTSPELVMEGDAASTKASGEIDDQLKNLNVDDIDLGFEEKARSTG